MHARPRQRRDERRAPRRRRRGSRGRSAGTPRPRTAASVLSSPRRGRRRRRACSPSVDVGVSTVVAAATTARLCGIVTFAPAKPSARARARRPPAAPARRRAATYAQSSATRRERRVLHPGRERVRDRVAEQPDEPVVAVITNACVSGTHGQSLGAVRGSQRVAAAVRGSLCFGNTELRLPRFSCSRSRTRRPWRRTRPRSP